MPAYMIEIVTYCSRRSVEISARICLLINESRPVLICNGESCVGATENFNWIPLGGKWFLTAAMLLGRLELYTVIIAFAPSSWKK